jgi:RHS repeat-associated protein
MNAFRSISSWSAAVGCALTLWTVPAAFAQQYPSQQRGLSADTAFQVGAIDHVNLFNGGLTLTLPLGQSYPVGPNLSYALTLSYSSNGWDYEDAVCLDGMINRYSIPIESPHTNAGFGWRIVPGKILTRNESPFVPPARYVGPDGSERGFYAELHPGYPSTPQPNTWFSNDSTYLRLRYYTSGCTAAPGSGSPDCYQVEFPDGTVHEFHWFSAGDEEREWLLTRMTDRFERDHWVSFDYSTADRWTITDSHGRLHRVIFSGGRVSRVEMAAFDGTTATTTLIRTSTAIARQNFIHPDCDMTADPLTVPLLTRVELPDGSYYEMSYETQSSSVQLSGGISSLRLPTGGEFRWDYQGIDFNSQAPTIEGAEFAQTAWGVATKELYTAAGDPSSLEGTWTYDYETVGNPVMMGDQLAVPCFHKVTVTDPLDNATVHYFDTAGLNRWQYGLPYRRCELDSGTVLSPPYPSEEIWQGGTLVRSIYVDYDSDGLNGGSHQEKNHRMNLRRVEYEDDAPRYQQVVYADFDGLGHFRTMTTTGNFTASGESRDIVTEYNEGSGTLILDPDDSSPEPGNDFMMPSSGAPWVLETFTRREVTEGDTATAQFCFDEDTGFLKRTRILAGSSPAGIDVLRVFTEETIGGQGTGRVAVERTYGGDDPGDLATGDLCLLTLPAQPQHKVTHIYQYGVLKRSKVIDPCDDTEILILVNHDLIDANTGLTKRSRDSAGVATVFDYDEMGRLILVQPPTSAWTVTEYDLPTVAEPGQVPWVTTYECPDSGTCNSSTRLSWQRFTFDGLGRKVREGREILDVDPSQPIARTFGYNAMGWMTAESLWGDTDATTFLHDRFGRVTEIDPADTSLAKTLFVYEGDRQIERTDSVATMLGGEDDRQRTCRREKYDTFGRLVSVDEDLASNGSGDCNTATGLLTTYAYDEADRLVHVCGRGDTGGCVQERVFDYDNRGFLLSEQHPEIGGSTYTYDASGNVLSKDLTGSGDFSLRYRYDPANRLIGVDEVVTPSPLTVRPLKEFQYARSNDGVDKRAGKLVTSKRINWVDPVAPLFGAVGSIPAAITQAYRYEGRDGRISARQTSATLGVGHYAFLTEFEWDRQGNLDLLSYPRCLHPGCVGGDVARDVDFTYQRGFLKTVEGYATNLLYQLGGMLHQVSHSNGVTETIATKSNSPMQRPHQITTSGVAGGNNWSSGIYLYDGAGNVKSIGDQLYQYDRMSRLLVGETLVGAQEKTQSLTYDAFGNILSLNTDGSVQSTPTDEATNRMTDAGYDAGGNVTDLTLGGETYQYTYDPLNMMKYLQSDTGQARVFLYDADDERIMTFDCAFVDAACAVPAQLTTTIRGLDVKVLRVYKQPFGGAWDWERDYVYRDGQLLASVGPRADGGEDTVHFHLDHLGSPRQITDEDGMEVAFHTYYPFGGEATDPSQDDVQLKFTGHERDDNGSAGAGVLDYMHARYCSLNIGRFLSPDALPLTRSSRYDPRRWNRYAYAAGNPLKYVDPTGNAIIAFGAAGPEDAQAELEALQAALQEAGAADLASKLAITEVNGEFQIDAGGDLKLFTQSTNPTAKLFGQAIDTSTPIAFDVTSDNLSKYGGAVTFSDPIGAKRVNEIQIRINPKQVAEVSVQGEFISGPFKGVSGTFGVTFGTAVVHEFGHASAYFLFNMPRRGSQTNADALRYENLHRGLLAKPCCTKRTEH